MTISFKLGRTHLIAKYTGKKIARYKELVASAEPKQEVRKRYWCVSHALSEYSLTLLDIPLLRRIAVIDAAVEPDERGPCTRKKFAADGRSPRLFLLAEDFLLARNFLHSLAIFFLA